MPQCNDVNGYWTFLVLVGDGSLAIYNLKDYLKQWSKSIQKRRRLLKGTWCKTVVGTRGVVAIQKIGKSVK